MQLKNFCFFYILYNSVQTPEHHLGEEYYAYCDGIFDFDSRCL